MSYLIQFLTFFRILIAPFIFLLITAFNLYGWALFFFFRKTLIENQDLLSNDEYVTQVIRLDIYQRPS